MDAETVTFVYVDPGHSTASELRSWGAAHKWLWKALRRKSLGVQVVTIGADHKATRRAQTALRRWSEGASEPDEQIAEGQAQDDPAVKAEMQYIENAIINLDTELMGKYGGFQGTSKRLIELKTLPRSKGTTGVSIDGYETWVSRRLRVLDSDL